MADGSSSGGRRRKGGSKRPRAGRPTGRPRTRPQLTPEQITDAAIRIADGEGLEAVTIRRIAAELDARPMSLYDHFSGKDELFASMLNRVSGESIASEPLPADWRRALTTIATLNFAMLIRHPWVPPAVGKVPRFGPNTTRSANQALAATASLGFEPAQVWLLVGTMNDFVVGHALRAGSLAAAADLSQVIPPEDLREFPALASLPDSLRSRSSIERFQAGLKIFLNGIESEIRGREET